MLKCIQCQHEFTKDDTKVIKSSYEYMFGVDKIFHTRTPIYIHLCPKCDAYLTGDEKEYFKEYYENDKEYKNNIIR